MRSAEYDLIYDLELRHWWYVSLRRVVATFWPSHMERGKPRILDAGCGTGGLLHMLADKGVVFGVDLEPVAIDYCRKRGIPATGVASVLALPFGEASFDIVTSMDVLSHAGVDPYGALREMSRVLRADGALILNLPAYPWLMSSHDLAVSNDKRFTLSRVRSMLAYEGFDVVAASYWNTWLFPVAAAVRIMGKLSGRAASDVRMPPDWVNNWLMGILEMERRILSRINLPFGLSIFVVARKTA